MSAVANVVTPRSGRFLREDLLSLLRPHKSRISIVVILVLLTATLELLPPLVVQWLIDQHLKTGDAGGLWLMALAYLAAVGGAQVLGFGHSYLTAVVAQHSLHNLRMRIVRHLQVLPTSYLDRTSTGDLISRVTADIETINTLFSTGVAILVADVVRLVTVVIAMVVLSPLLTAVSLATVPPLVLVTAYYRSQVAAAERRTRLAVSSLNIELQETLSGAEVIRAFGHESAFVARFFTALRSYLTAANRAAVFFATYPAVMQISSACVIAVLLWVGVSGSQLFGDVAPTSVGTLAAFVLLFRRFFAPITALGDEWQTVQTAIAGAERAFEVLGEPPEVRPLANPGADHTGSVARRRLPVEVQGLRFGYGQGLDVLQGVTFSVHRGEHLAVVGRTGAGKSSLLHLLAGQYALRAGEIAIEGMDPRSVAAEKRRHLFGVVPQTGLLFTGTVHDNITLEDERLDRQTVEKAARLAGAHDFITTLPQGYDTFLGSRGVSLSAGQHQLLALARALVWEAPVLLLDEATSAIDALTEVTIRRALREISQNRAVITIAHRLATAREADRVIVLEEGKIVEEGNPESLLEANGRFAAMVQLESAGWEWNGFPGGQPDDK
jgi:ATP-binding cassette, subfamily B, multidrug efflux pump